MRYSPVHIYVKEVAKGENQAPYYYIFPKNQLDQSELVNMVNLFDEHGISVYKLNKDIQRLLQVIVAVVVNVSVGQRIQVKRLLSRLVIQRVK